MPSLKQLEEPIQYRRGSLYISDVFLVAVGERSTRRKSSWFYVDFIFSKKVFCASKYPATVRTIRGEQKCCKDQILRDLLVTGTNGASNLYDLVNTSQLCGVCCAHCWIPLFISFMLAIKCSILEESYTLSPRCHNWSQSNYLEGIVSSRARQ